MRQGNTSTPGGKVEKINISHQKCAALARSLAQTGTNVLTPEAASLEDVVPEMQAVAIFHVDSKC